MHCNSRPTLLRPFWLYFSLRSAAPLPILLLATLATLLTALATLLASTLLIALRILAALLLSGLMTGAALLIALRIVAGLLVAILVLGTHEFLLRRIADASSEICALPRLTSGTVHSSTPDRTQSLPARNRRPGLRLSKSSANNDLAADLFDRRRGAQGLAVAAVRFAGPPMCPCTDRLI